MNVEEIKEEVSRCELCGRCERGEGHERAVHGRGDVPTEVMFVIDAPGKHDLITGRTLSGAEGPLLGRACRRALVTPRSYRTCLVKCGAAGGKHVTKAEASACARWLDAEIEAVRPRVIVALGSIAGQFLTGQKGGAMSLRGKVHDTERGPVVVSVHPSSLEWHPEWERVLVEDIRTARAVARGEA